MTSNRNHGRGGVPYSRQGDGGLHLHVHEHAAEPARDPVRGAGLPEGRAASRGPAPPGGMGRRDERRGEQDHARGYTLAAPSLPRLFPVRQRLPFDPG